MMRYQDAVLEELKRLATKAGLETTEEFSFSNVGVLRAQRGLTQTVAWVQFMFSSGHNTFTFNTTQMSPDGHIVRSPNDDDELQAVLEHWWRLLTEEKAGGQ
jgi:hypothetical protein